MGTVLSFETHPRSHRSDTARQDDCEIVIFPGVRIERHEVDPSHRLLATAGSGCFDQLGGSGRPRKTS